MTTYRDALIELLIAGGDTCAANAIRRNAKDALMIVELRTSAARHPGLRNPRDTPMGDDPPYLRALDRARQLARVAWLRGLDAEVQP
jgi:hypothetical protein